MDITQIIVDRKSVRTFDANRPLDAATVEAVKKSIADVDNPFGGKFTIDFRQFDIKGPLKPSTYGTIDGASWYLLMGIADNVESALSAGYGMEQVVLRCRELGLGTCWMALTFKGSDFVRDVPMPADQPLRIVSPVGYPAPKRRIIESMTRATLGSSARRPMDTMFSEGEFGHPVSDTNMFYQALAMMRLAPSAKNSQPWRALVSGTTVCFYYEEKTEAAALDLGIGLCHFALTLKQNGIIGHWDKPVDFPAHDNYVPAVRFVQGD